MNRGRAFRREVAERLCLRRWRWFVGLTTGEARQTAPQYRSRIEMHKPRGIYRKWNGACGCKLCRICRGTYSKKDRRANQALCLDLSAY